MHDAKLTYFLHVPLATEGTVHLYRRQQLQSLMYIKFHYLAQVPSKVSRQSLSVVDIGIVAMNSTAKPDAQRLLTLTL